MNDTAPEHGEHRLGLFEGYGIELEYMIVDARDLAVLPVADEVLKAQAGGYVNEVGAGALRWSNELVLHVIELKTNGPAPRLHGLHHAFQQDILRIEALLRRLGGRLMPTAMHPWMDPLRDTRLWPHGDGVIYRAFDRIFGCRGHGWSNLQSMHINLPFADDAEFARLHAAVRLCLPLLPALAASSPVVEGRPTGTLDNRLVFYRDNARRIPSVSGAIIPEPVYSRAEYEAGILQRIYHDLAPHDPGGVLRHEWVNARGAIARFERNTIEIRILDVQECPAADLALGATVIETLRALSEEAWCGLRRLQEWDGAALQALLAKTIRNADQALIDDPRYTAAFGFPERGRCRARELWQHLIETLVTARPDTPAPWRAVLDLYLRRGTLAQRIAESLGANPDRSRLVEIYRTLCDCLRNGTPFDG